MNVQWYDVVGNLGVLFIIIGYLLLQMKKIESSSVLYSTLNALGAGLVLVSLIGAFNLAAFVLEVFWLLISLWGVFTAVLARQHRTVNATLVHPDP